MSAGQRRGDIAARAAAVDQRKDVEIATAIEGPAGVLAHQKRRLLVQGAELEVGRQHGPLDDAAVGVRTVQQGRNRIACYPLVDAALRRSGRVRVRRIRGDFLLYGH